MGKDFELNYEPVPADDAQERLSRALDILLAAGQRARLANKGEQVDRHGSAEVPQDSDD
ncbi:MAG TPA: hypothetical protein VM221_11830 [Armatimonadota bacterium]|nr:hypothetical protein [Armatimonadota bacterium]